MNKRMLECNTQKVFAVGMAGSIADLKEKLNICFSCQNFITCENSQAYLNGIISQQNNFIALNRIRK